MADVGTAFRIIGLTSIMSLITCAIIGMIMVILRKLTSRRKEGVN